MSKANKNFPIQARAADVQIQNIKFMMQKAFEAGVAHGSGFYHTDWGWDSPEDDEYEYIRKDDVSDSPNFETWFTMFLNQ